MRVPAVSFKNPFPLPRSLEIIQRLFKYKIPYFSERISGKLTDNTDLLRRANEASRKFSAAVKAGNLSDNDRADLKAASLALATEVFKVSKLIHVDADAGDFIIDQLVKNEKVHPVSKDDMKELRLGARGTNKNCHALVIETNDGSIVLSQIFSYHSEVNITDGGIHTRDLQGNVDDIKVAAITPLSGKENTLGYYTVSMSFAGAGSEIIKRLAAVKPKKTVAEVTYSPVRQYLEGMSRDEILELDDDDIKRQVLLHLLGNENSVKKFHVGNGAYIGGININRDAPEDSKDWITINYIYDREKVGEYKEAYNKGQGKVALSQHLQELLSVDEARQGETLSIPSIIPANSQKSRVPFRRAA